MIYIETDFDANNIPISSAIVDDDVGEIVEIDLYKSSDLSIKEVEKRVEGIRDLLMRYDAISANNWKAHIHGFRIPVMYNGDIFCRITGKGGLKERVETALSQGPKSWQWVSGKAHRAYAFMENRGFRVHQERLVYTDYNLETFSGRSASSGKYPIQNLSDKFCVMSPIELQNYYVCFDWVSAEARIAAIMAGDKKMMDTFKDSDPYTEIATKCGSDRADVKKEWFRSIYSMDFSSGIFQFFPDLLRWLMESEQAIKKNHASRSILGREYLIDEERDIRSVFNASLQGSVAHAMQSVLGQIVDLMPGNLLTEIHDSLIMVCQEHEIENVVNKVGAIMLHPFRKILGSNPSMPLKISVGTAWKKWDFVRRMA